MAQRRHLIFDGSGRDPLNICGRVISRLAAVGYRVHMVIVLCSHATCRQRAAVRLAQTGRETPLAFVDMVFRSLQSAVPIYLRQHAEICERALLYTNEAAPELRIELNRGTPHLVPRAVDLALGLLALPDDPPPQGAELRA